MDDIFILRNQRIRDLAKAAIDAADQDRVVLIKDKTRTLEQNSKMWAMLHDISAQKEWFVDGVMRLLEDWEWKIILTAGLGKEQHIAQGINGGFVSFGQPTSKMTIREMSELIEFMYFFGATHDLTWSEKVGEIPADIAARMEERNHG